MCVSVCETHHALKVHSCTVNRGTLGGVAIAEAVATDDHVVESVVVLLGDLITGVQQVVTQCVQLGELHSYVCYLQHVYTHIHTHTHSMCITNCKQSSKHRGLSLK